MTRYLNSFFITMVLYLFAVFFFFFLFADSVIIPEKEERIISINHIKVAQQQPTPQESVSEPEPEKEVEPEPIIEKKIHKPKKEKRHEEKKREHKKPIQEPIKQIVEEPKEEVVPNIKPVENTPISNEPPKQQVNASEIESIEALYLSQLRAKIEKNKVYPNSAKRLNQKGKVYVTFTLSKDGQITNIKISKSSDFDKLDEAALKILADIKAIEPIPKELNKSTWEITVPIVYQIK